jgi:DNA adenine methylase
VNRARPILRWHGGKWRLAPWILSNFPEHKVYVEPYGGAGSVLIRKQRSYAEIYNDLDGEVVNLFNMVRECGRQLGENLYLTPYARTEFVKSYEKSEDTLEQARRTVIRSFMGFGSNSHNKKTGFRSNSNRSGTTPAHDWKNYPECLAQTIDRLRGVVIENRDAKQVMLQHDSPDTLHYVDPPYLPETRDKGRDYRHEMNVSEHLELLQFLKTLRGRVVLSCYNTPMYDDVLVGWQKHTKQAYADGARKRQEVLFINN